MAIALVAHLGQSEPNNGGNPTWTTSASMNSTGANFIVCSISADSNSSSVTVTDNKGNTYTKLTGVKAITFYAVNPTVGTGHTFTISGIADTSICAAAFSGVDTTSPFDLQGTNSSSGLTSASVTPSNVGSLVISGIGPSSSVPSAASGFTITDTVVPVSFGGNGAAMAYLIQTSIAAAQTTWTNSGNGLQFAVSIVVFKPSISGDLTETFSDSLSLSDVLSSGTGGGLNLGLSDTLTISDLLASFLTSPAFSLSDTLIFSDLFVEFLTSTEILLSEVLVFLDSSVLVLDLPLTSSDSLSFSDVILLLQGIGLGLSEVISLSDFLVTYFILAKRLNDNFLFSDALIALIANSPLYSDQVSLSDVAQIQLSLGYTFVDTFALSDSLQSNSSNNLLLTIPDTLSFSDSLLAVLSSDLDSYIRHYLNDVPN